MLQLCCERAQLEDGQQVRRRRRDARRESVQRACPAAGGGAPARVRRERGGPLEGCCPLAHRRSSPQSPRPQVLELGCGWGSWSLFMAAKYPSSKVTAVSNSRTQRAFIEGEAK